MELTAKQSEVLKNVADQVSIMLAEWMREKMEAGMTIEEVANMIDAARKQVVAGA